MLNLFSGPIRGNCICFQHTRFEKIFYFGLSLLSPRNCQGKTKNDCSVAAVPDLDEEQSDREP